MYILNYKIILFDTFATERSIYVALLPIPQTADKITNLHIDLTQSCYTYHRPQVLYNSSNGGIF